MAATIVSIVYRPTHIEQRPADHYGRVPVERVRLVVGHGIQGDTKGSRGKRQLNVMQAEMVEQLQAEGFHAGPGGLGEQIVVAGLDADALAPGSRLQLGDSAIIEV